MSSEGRAPTPISRVARAMAQKVGSGAAMAGSSDDERRWRHGARALLHRSGHLLRPNQLTRRSGFRGRDRVDALREVQGRCGPGLAQYPRASPRAERALRQIPAHDRVRLREQERCQRRPTKVIRTPCPGRGVPAGRDGVRHRGAALSGPSSPASPERLSCRVLDERPERCAVDRATEKPIRMRKPRFAERMPPYALPRSS